VETKAGIVLMIKVLLYLMNRENLL